MGNHFKKIKIAFVAGVVIMLSVVWIGIDGVHNNQFYISKKYALLTFDYIKFKARAISDDGVVQAAGADFYQNTTDGNQNASWIPVLVYHKIADEKNGTNISRKIFEDQMFYLKESGFHTVSLDDLEKFLEGKISLPEKSFVITFDDGAKESFYPADPILHALGYKAVMFVIAAHSLSDGHENSGGYYLNTSEIKAMSKSGRWEIGSHTYDCHSEIPIDASGNMGDCLTNKMWLADKNRLETDEEYYYRIRTDLTEAKKEISDKLGVDTNSFAFPFGDYGYDSKNIAADKYLDGVLSRLYKLNFYQPFGGESIENKPDPNKEDYYVRRIKVSPDWSGEQLVSAITSGTQQE